MAGATDIKTLQQFLRLYGKDREILVLPLGGSQLINSGREVELAELTRITTNIAALVDSEKSNDSAVVHMDRIALRDSCNGLGIVCHILERRAIENYLTDRAVKIV